MQTYTCETCGKDRITPTCNECAEPTDYTVWGERELIERIHELERAQKTRTTHTVQALDDIAQDIDWDNYQDTDEDGEQIRSWTVPEALFCKTQEVIQELGAMPGTEEATDLLAHLAELLEAMQADHINEREEY